MSDFGARPASSDDLDCSVSEDRPVDAGGVDSVEGEANRLDSTHRLTEAAQANSSALGLDPRDDDDGLDSGDAFADEAYDSAMGQDPGELDVRNPGELDLPESVTDDGANDRSR